MTPTDRTLPPWVDRRHGPGPRHLEHYQEPVPLTRVRLAVLDVASSERP